MFAYDVTKHRRVPYRYAMNILIITASTLQPAVAAGAETSIWLLTDYIIGPAFVGEVHPFVSLIRGRVYRKSRPVEVISCKCTKGELISSAEKSRTLSAVRIASMRRSID